MIKCQEINQSIETDSDMTPMLGLSEREFKKQPEATADYFQAATCGASVRYCRL